MLTFICGMVGLVYSANLFFLYLCWEAMGLCSFSLVGFWYEKKESVAGARKVLLMTHLAGYGLLAAILLIFARTGSALWTDPAVAQAFSGGIYTLMLVALLAKSVQFPLHTWIPEAMNAPTPVSALLHAACYVKAGVYLAARMHCFNQWPGSWGFAMMWLGRCDDGCRGGLRDGAARPQADARLSHGEPDRLYHYRPGAWHSFGDCRGIIALPQSQPVQGRPLSGRRFGAARYRNPGT